MGKMAPMKVDKSSATYPAFHKYRVVPRYAPTRPLKHLATTAVKVMAGDPLEPFLLVASYHRT